MFCYALARTNAIASTTRAYAMHRNFLELCMLASVAAPPLASAMAIGVVHLLVSGKKNRQARHAALYATAAATDCATIHRGANKLQQEEVFASKLFSDVFVAVAESSPGEHGCTEVAHALAFKFSKSP